jgi:hypothetical protein
MIIEYEYMATDEEVPDFAKCYSAEIEAKVKESIRMGQVKGALIKILRNDLTIAKKYQMEAEEATGGLWRISRGRRRRRKRSG